VRESEHSTSAQKDLVRDLYRTLYELAATHSGELLDVPATGNRSELTNAVLSRIEDGQVVDEWPRTDMLGLVGGIGVVDLPFRHNRCFLLFGPELLQM
jgi:hypothetical protein